MVKSRDIYFLIHQTKNILFGIVLCLITLYQAQAELFPLKYVCMPKTEKLGSPLDFQVRTKGQCLENEQWMQVHQQKGVWLLVPSDPPLSKEEQEDLDKAKSFWGGSE
ncbi:MAG: hypothetical protein H7A32_02720 [Deltaproteobacteria bacterium]|nr:hypothetical protein [Deltaproteobacteria bacterium]